MKSKLDIKTIFILVLAAALILSFIFRPSKQIDDHTDELERLSIENDSLNKSNGILFLANGKLQEKIVELIININSTQAELASTEDKLNDLENDKGKVSGFVSTLDADGIANSLTEYLNKK